MLEDLDLVVGNRRVGRDGGGLHDFLTALDGVMSSHDGIVTIATTNDVRALDDAAVRAARFDRIIEIPLPDAGLRASILRRYLGTLGAGIDVDAVARLQLRVRAERLCANWCAVQFSWTARGSRPLHCSASLAKASAQR